MPGGVGGAPTPSTIATPVPAPALAAAVRCFSEVTPSDGRLDFQVIDLGRQVYVWVAAGGAKLGSLCFSIQSPQGGASPSTAMLLRGGAGASGEGLAQRLGERQAGARRARLCMCARVRRPAATLARAALQRWRGCAASTSDPPSLGSHAPQQTRRPDSQRSSWAAPCCAAATSRQTLRCCRPWLNGGCCASCQKWRRAAGAAAALRPPAAAGATQRGRMTSPQRPAAVPPWYDGMRPAPAQQQFCNHAHHPSVRAAPQAAGALPCTVWRARIAPRDCARRAHLATFCTTEQLAT